MGLGRDGVMGGDESDEEEGRDWTVTGMGKDAMALHHHDAHYAASPPGHRAATSPL